MIAESKGKPMRLCVFDTHTLRTRETVLIPTDDWGGSGLLGITIRLDIARASTSTRCTCSTSFPTALANDSAAGLDAYNDYILGVGDLLYDGPDEFGEIVLHNERRPVRLYVYSVRTEDVREVLITPNRQGGDGVLGCGVGSGYLHILPPRRDFTSHARRRPPPRRRSSRRPQRPRRSCRSARRRRRPWRPQRRREGKRSVDLSSISIESCLHTLVRSEGQLPFPIMELIVV